jgi:uncharacterized membrane protein YphA (DoxX/SURF4 family)
MTDRRVVAFLRVALGVVFLVAAWPKLADPEGFARAISHYRMLPEPVERVAALVLPPLEALLGICLVLGVLDAGASLLVLVLLTAFTGAIAAALARGLDISCGCFDTEGGAKVGLSKVVENLAMLAAAFLVTRADRSWLSLTSWLRRSGDIE